MKMSSAPFAVFKSVETNGMAKNIETSILLMAGLSA
jgi:hypothetical protein